MTPKFLVDCIKNKLTRIKAVITMYMGGFPDNVSQFYNLKKIFFFNIEDACHAFGATYKYQNKKFKIGSCKHSDICTFFSPTKTNYNRGRR